MKGPIIFMLCKSSATELNLILINILIFLTLPLSLGLLKSFARHTLIRFL